MTRVPLVCAYAHCYTTSRKVLANSATNRMDIILRGNSICSINRGNSICSINRGNSTCSRACYLHSHQARSHVFSAMSSIFFLEDQKQFRYAARSVVTLTATEQLHTPSNERRLSASRDIRSVRIAITVPCQCHQQKSLVSLFRAIAELSRYDIIYIFAVPAPVCSFGFRNS